MAVEVTNSRIEMHKKFMKEEIDLSSKKWTPNLSRPFKSLWSLVIEA